MARFLQSMAVCDTFLLKTGYLRRKQELSLAVQDSLRVRKVLTPDDPVRFASS